MKYLDFKEKLAKHVCFSLADIRLIDPSFRRRQLNEWKNQGYIKPVRRGYYMFSDVARSNALLFALSNKIYPPSYVSLESALSYYGLIPEGVFTVTAVSTKNTASFDTPVAAFRYQHLKPDLFFGYVLLPNGAKMASIEKLLLDYLYFHAEICQAADFKAWRFNSDEFLRQADQATLRTYASAYPQTVQTRLETLLQRITDSCYA